MPCAAPAWLTRSMNAGGNEYSRPQSNPTFTRTPSASSRALRRPALDAGFGLFDEPAHDRFQVAGLAIDLQLSIRAGALFEDFVHVGERVPAAQVVDHVVNE